MTPEMTASQITFGRKTEVIADMLRDKWYWGIRTRSFDMDERERDYDQCFPPSEADRGRQTRSEVVDKMIARRRERMVLDSLRDLVRYLGSVREERKAILAVTQGWVLFRPDSLDDTSCGSWSGTGTPNRFRATSRSAWTRWKAARRRETRA